MGENHQPRVDIIIAARNEERYLAHCLDALRAQDYPGELLQIYLVDNGSTDGTVRIAEEYGINVLAEPKPGPAAARNAAIAQSSGEIIGAGLFNDKLQACEDVDLAWRVVLLGYQLSYVPQAQLTHYNCDSWLGFFSKYMTKGQGAAMLSATYRQHGGHEKFLPAQIWSTKPEKFLAGLYYWAGYRKQEWRLRLNLDAQPEVRPRAQVQERFRGSFQWTSQLTLRISEDAIFWFRNEKHPTSVIVHIPTKQRIVLDGVGDLIWRRIVGKTNRDGLVQELVSYYGVAAVTAATDLDELIEELIEAEILMKVSG